MKNIVLVLSVLILGYSNAQAQELDNEKIVINQKVLAKELPKTLVVRINRSTNEVEVLHLNEALPPDASSMARIEKSEFKTVSANQKPAKELDRDGSVSSWAFTMAGRPSQLPSNPSGGHPSQPIYPGHPSQPIYPAHPSQPIYVSPPHYVYPTYYYPHYYYYPTYYPYVPTYYYGGYTVPYAPYYGYNSGPYSYGYYGMNGGQICQTSACPQQQYQQQPDQQYQQQPQQDQQQHPDQQQQQQQQNQQPPPKPSES